jgi:hypothetical protein
LSIPEDDDQSILSQSIPAQINKVVKPSTTKSPTSTEVLQFQRTIKRDKANYLDLASDDYWEPYHRRLKIQTRAEDVWQILEPKPSNMTSSEEALDQAKNTYMFSVFEHTLKTSKGKSILCDHLDTFDARAVYQDLVKVMKTSLKGSCQRQAILRFITSARYSLNVLRITAEHFVLLFKEKFRLLDELHSDAAKGWSDEI